MTTTERTRIRKAHLRWLIDRSARSGNERLIAKSATWRRELAQT